VFLKVVYLILALMMDLLLALLLLTDVAAVDVSSSLMNDLHEEPLVGSWWVPLRWAIPVFCTGSISTIISESSVTLASCRRLPSYLPDDANHMALMPSWA
jgi:hypothetical protein